MNASLAGLAYVVCGMGKKSRHVLIASVVVMLTYLLIATLAYNMQPRDQKSFTAVDTIAALGVQSGKSYPVKLGASVPYTEMNVESSAQAAGLFFFGGTGDATSRASLASGDSIKLGFTNEQQRSFIFAVPTSKISFAVETQSDAPSIVFQVDPGFSELNARFQSYLIDKGNFFNHAGRQKAELDVRNTDVYKVASQRALGDVLVPSLMRVDITLSESDYAKYIGMA